VVVGYLIILLFSVPTIFLIIAIIVIGQIINDLNKKNNKNIGIGDVLLSRATFPSKLIKILGDHHKYFKNSKKRIILLLLPIILGILIFVLILVIKKLTHNL